MKDTLTHPWFKTLFISGTLLSAQLLNGQVLLDNWNNNNLHNTGRNSIPADARNFWQSSSSTPEGSQAKVSIFSGSEGGVRFHVNELAGATLSSSLRTSEKHAFLNFFEAPLRITLTGVTYTAARTDSNVFMIAVASEAGGKATDAGANGSAQQFGVRVRPNQRVEVGARESTSSGLFDGRNKKLDRENSGVVLNNTTIEITLNATDYEVKFINPHQPALTLTFNGKHNLDASKWGSGETRGHSGIGFLNQSFNSGLNGDVVIESVTVRRAN